MSRDPGPHYNKTTPQALMVLEEKVLFDSGLKKDVSSSKIFSKANIENNPELRVLLDCLRSSVLYVDRWGTVQHANAPALRWRSMDTIVGVSFLELAFSWDNPFERQREIMQVMRSDTPSWRCLERSYEHGVERWYEVDKIPIHDGKKNVCGALLIIDEVTETVRQERALEESEARYRAFVSTSADAIWRCDLCPPVNLQQPIHELIKQIYRRSELVECNQRLLEIFGLTSSSELVGTSFFMHSAMVKKNDIKRFIENDYRIENGEFIGEDKKGTTIMLSSSVVGVIENGSLVRFWGTSRDITEQRQHLGRMEYLADHDALTALPNRSYLYRHIEQALSKRHTNQCFALLLIDLDRFKEINDTLGHHAGDKVLRQLGPRLKAVLGGSSGTVARLGGDEFAIFLNKVRNPQHAVVMAHRFLDAILQVFEIDGYRTEIGASIGIALAPDQANDVTTLMRYADIAMYHAKTRLKGVSTYDASFDSHSPFRLELMGALGRAIRENELRLHFQPKVCLKSRRVYGFESLLRWEHPELGFIPPNEFIPIAETSSIIHPLTLWVLEEAVKQCAAWRTKGYDITVALNLSVRNLLDDRIVDELKRMLDAYQLDGRYLEMEITESMIMSDPKRAQLALHRISEHGVKLSVDDFGTGYSSLAYLKRLPVQALKIDSAFVLNMLEDEQDEIIVNSTIQLAHNLGLSVVAEGVESDAIFKRLHALGCDNAQGYFIAKPMSCKHIELWIEKCEWDVGRGV